MKNLRFAFLVIGMVGLGCANVRTPEAAIQKTSGKPASEIKAKKISETPNGESNYEAIVGGVMYRVSCRKNSCSVYYTENLEETTKRQQAEQDAANEREARKKEYELGKIKTTYDEFQKKTRVALVQIVQSSDDEISLVVGGIQGDTSVIGLLLTTESKDWRYLKCHSLDLLVDGNPVQLETKHDGDINKGFVTEKISSLIKPELVKQVAAASEVKGRLCQTVFKINTAKWIDLAKELGL